MPTFGVFQVKHSSVFPVARVALRIVIVLNWLFGGAIVALLIATLVAEQWTFTALGISPSSGIRSMIVGLRAIAALGVVAVPLNDAVLRRLLAIVDTVRSGDPFVGANADRLKVIERVAHEVAEDTPAPSGVAQPAPVSNLFGLMEDEPEWHDGEIEES